MPADAGIAPRCFPVAIGPARLRSADSALRLDITSSGALLPALSRAKDAGRSAACKNHLHQMGLALAMYVSDNRNTYPPYDDWNAPIDPYVPVLPHRWVGKVALNYSLAWSNAAYHCPGYKGAIFPISTRAPSPDGGNWDLDEVGGSYAYNANGFNCPWGVGVPGGAILVHNPLLGLGGRYVGLRAAQVAVPSEMLAIGESMMIRAPQADIVSPPGYGCDFMVPVALQFVLLGSGWPLPVALPQRHGKKYNQLMCDGRVIAVERVKWHNPTNSAIYWNNDHQPHPELWKWP